MFTKINQAQVQKIMKRMGISQTPLDAKRVIIELEDSNIIIDEPSVTKIVMQGQESFQISGETREETRQNFSDEDVKMVMEKTGASEEKVRQILKENDGDIADAIIKLKQNNAN